MVFGLYRHSYRRSERVILAISMIGVLIVVMQDVLHAHVNAYNFYITESLLFCSLWILVYPVYRFNSWLYKLLISTGRAIRSLLVITIGSLVHLLLYALTVHVVSELFLDHSYSITQVLLFAIPSNLLSVLAINSLILWYFDSLGNSNTLNEVVKKDMMSSLTINYRGVRHVIDFDQIECVKSANPYVLVITRTRKLLYTATLKSLEEKLGGSFMRIHKSTIVNLSKIESYRSRSNGDYDVTLKQGEEVRLSRNYAKEFKSRLTNSSQL